MVLNNFEDGEEEKGACDCCDDECDCGDCKECGGEGKDDEDGESSSNYGTGADDLYNDSARDDV
ncbi:MAG: hypothetical protein A2261_00185 [Candidatus Magasanikbacteria bacterium RIFOXYA2_FULL_44_8]|uniref:Uncharacterized protein n=1 Tax=Candidatus Magasanikbacteria bacterium RIFOXYA2_FULL_44_8 TaxID=1798696 RepID=A0A1F6NKA1_9BACT|nr:MAG: hypothetical protein A2261_00185 [Candidatus Magasanikbacteria bacterium RIFOXYA2_FULL_44_8]